MSRIVFDHVSVQFGGLKVVDDVSFSIADREFVSVIGPSGCGKSTLLRCINRINDRIPGAHVTSGSIHIHDIAIALYQSGFTRHNGCWGRWVAQFD